ncbi:qde-1 RNA-dependent RNA polymerase [Fusarium albosuccineum]|uniref:RNA-dependent RNA polymerase n=1 Tax=Fusarium albosuccineum TaxID=1237068 RepID=A0A8H4LD08_9HYPO|nr:qde-1 RNA-dependent RNA polymerase [Fusarium albosuccineum]
MSAPLTSSRKLQAQEELNRAIRSLSFDFQLQLQIPDPTLSPSKRRLLRRTEEQERSDAIYRRAHYLKFQDPHRLSTCLGRFREQADEHLKNWVRKPRADPDTTPIKSSFHDPHRSRLSCEERAELQTFLLGLLQDDNIVRQQRSKYSKRNSDEFPDPNAKRSRGSFEGPGDSPCNSIDDIPVRTRPSTRVHAGRPATQAAGTIAATRSNGTASTTTSFSKSQSFSFGAQSFNSSKVSLAPTIFSATTDDGATSTQTTIISDRSFKNPQTSFSRSLRQFEYQPPVEVTKHDDNEPQSPLLLRKYEYQPPEAIDEPMLPASDTPRTIIRTQPLDIKFPQPIRSSSPATAYSSLPEMAELDTPILGTPVFGREVPSCALTDRLRNIWPKFPIPGLNQAPLIILWELTRAALHCRVDLSQWDLAYKPTDAWHDQKKFRGQVLSHRLFVGQGLPPSCDRIAWDAALGSFSVQDKNVALLAEFIYNTEDSGPLYRLKLHAPRLELGHRLGRRFGADRFMEIIMPSPTSRDAPDIIKQDEQGPGKVIRWLAENAHYFIGRSWAPFFTREAKKTVKDSQPPHKTITIMQERVYFFATDGINFRLPEDQFPPLEEAKRPANRTKMRRCDLLNWAIGVERNAKQPVPKLFSRLALNLSKTCPTIVLEPHQFRHQETMLGFHKYMRAEDMKAQQDMGDGIGRMSRGLARKVATHLGLTEAPCAFQARIGSAKGMWIVDVDDDGLDDKDWIETYPSQRKWECDFQDIHHRTFEVREWSRELRPAGLNQQFIPVLEAQALRPRLMREAIAKHLVNGLSEEIGGQLAAMTHPTNLRSFTHRGFDRSTLGHVPFLGALPERDEDIVSFMLDSGFDATKNRYLRDLVWSMQKRQADQLKAKMNIKIPRSTYAYMVVDFTGTLEEGEVQLAFSSKFQAEGESDTLLDGIDILVARAPAHFVSDIQKVRAVFRPNLKRLKDVVVFSSKGKSPLADLLSGGDYDGDKAWVCWDPQIVENFTNAAKPVEPDLVRQGYLRKSNPSFQSILSTSRDVDGACTEFLHSAISFSMQPSYLGICTVFKEKLCYYERSVSSERAVALSTLVSLLVDQAKQGLLFTREDYDRLRRDMKMQGKDPEYLNERSSRYVNRDGSSHILDYLKFDVAENTIRQALTAFYDALHGPHVQAWDKDLTRLCDEFEAQRNDSRIIARLMTTLHAQISEMINEWKVSMAGSKSDNLNNEFATKVKELHQKWSSLQPSPELMSSRQVKPLLDSWNGDPALSKWEMLKASTMFKLGYKFAYTMLWRLSGQQLAWMKAMMSRGGSDVSAIAVTAEMWSVLRPDNKRITALNARRQAGHDNESLAALEEVTEYDEDGTQIDDA